MTTLTQTLHVANMRRRFGIDIKDISRAIHEDEDTISLWELGVSLPTSKQAEQYVAAVADLVTTPQPIMQPRTDRVARRDCRTILAVMAKLGVRGADIAALLGIPSRLAHKKLYEGIGISRAEEALIMSFLKARKLARMFGKDGRS